MWDVLGLKNSLAHGSTDEWKPGCVRGFCVSAKLD